MRFRAVSAGTACWALAFATAISLPAPARSEPMVRVRAESRLSATMGMEDGRYRVRGNLRDDLENPLADRELVVSVGLRGAAPREFGVATDGAGRFEAGLDSPEPPDVTVKFAGDALHTSAESTAEATGSRDRFAASLEWSISPGAILDLAAPRQHLEIALTPTAAHGPRPLSARTDFGPLGHAVLDGSGRARVEFASAALGPPRRAQIFVDLPGTATQAAVDDVRTIIVRGASALSLDVVSTGPASEITVGGSLEAAGEPLGGQAITIAAGATRLATVRTGADGRFLAAFAAPPVAGRKFLVSARYDSDAPWRASSESDPVAVTIPVGASLHPILVVIPALLCLMTLWWLRSRRGVTSMGTRGPSPDHPRVGFQAVRERRLSRATHLKIGGRIADVDGARGLDRATLRLVGPNDSIDIHAAMDGAFLSPELPAGKYTVCAEAPGYCAERARLVVPHRGEWMNLVIHLEQLRNRAFEGYRPAADALGPGTGAASLLTPREIAARGEGERRAPDQQAELAELTDLVELAAYGHELPTDGNVEEIRLRASKLAATAEPAGADGGPGTRTRATIPHRR